MSAAVTSAQRFTRRNPCPVCNGADNDKRGQGKRCSGFFGSDGKYAHCSRGEHAGALPIEPNGGTYAHLLTGPCRCGIAHGTRIGGGEKIGSSSSSKSKIVAEYDYRDEAGALLFTQVRFEPKSFAVRAPDGSWKLNGARRVLYRLPELLAAYVARTVWIVEGEKDVETLMRLEHLATCSPLGAGKWASVADMARPVLKGRCVKVIADRDDVGRKHARDVAASLRVVAASVELLECPDPYHDVSDLLAAGGKLPDLVPMQDPPVAPVEPVAPIGPAPDEDDAREPDVIGDETFPPPTLALPPPSEPARAPGTSSESHEAAPDNRLPVTLAQAFEARRKRGPLVRMLTGIEGIDLATCGGIPFGSTVFVVGAPDAAKTLLLFSIAVTWAREGVIVGFMAVDEEIDDLVTRLAQQTAKEISADGEVLQHFSRSDYEAGASEVVDHIEEKIGPLPIVFFDAAWTVERATAHLAHEGERLGKRAAFFADSLQTVRSEATPEDASERRVVADNAEAIRQAAVSFGMATLATSESNREYSKAKRKGDAAIAMSAGAESRAVEFKARALFVLSAVEDSNLIEVEIPKSKLGPRKTFHLAIDRATQTLSDALSPENPVKDPNSRAKAHVDRLRVQSEETAKRKADKKAEAERGKAAEVAERKTTQERTLVEILRANPGGLVTRDLKAKLKGLGSLTSGDELVIAERLGDAVRHGPAPKPAHHLAKLFVLVEDKLPPHLRQGAAAVKEEAAR